jgi:N-acetylglucosamine-6-phosphate deacetylase
MFKHNESNVPARPIIKFKNCLILRNHELIKDELWISGSVIIDPESFLHLFNAMLPFHHRDPGLVGLLASDQISETQPIYYGIIADGNHTHPSTTRIAYRAYPKGIVLVTDACSAMGLTEGIHHIGQQTIEVLNSKAFIQGTTTLAGSVATMISCIHYFWKTTSCTLVEALEAATLHPALLMKIENRKGTLQFGTDADLVILKPDSLEVLSTWIAGQCVYNNRDIPKI